MRYSKQRDLIYNIIKKDFDHLTAEQIYQKAREVMPKISLGTVYRNLSELVDANMIKHIPVPNGKDIYDKTLHQHFHFICLNCKNVQDIDVEIDNNKIEKYNDIEITSLEMIISGYCKNCRKED